MNSNVKKLKNELRENLLTVEEVKEIFRFKNKQTVYNLVYSKKLKSVKVTSRLMFHINDVKKLISESRK